MQQYFGETDGQYAARRTSNDWAVTGIMIRKPCLKLPLTDSQYYTWKLSYLKVEPGKIIAVLHAETQPAKHGSYTNGQLAADGKEQNTARAVHWKN
jgi:hypothetical protein